MIILPVSSQLLARLLDLLRERNEPGFDQEVEIWPDGDTTNTLPVFVIRRDGDYSLRLRCNGLTSLPVCHFRQRWQLDPDANARTQKLLSNVRGEKNNG